MRLEYAYVLAGAPVVRPVLVQATRQESALFCFLMFGHGPNRRGQEKDKKERNKKNGRTGRFNKYTAVEKLAPWAKQLALIDLVTCCDVAESTTWKKEAYRMAKIVLELKQRRQQNGDGAEGIECVPDATKRLPEWAQPRLQHILRFSRYELHDKYTSWRLLPHVAFKIKEEPRRWKNEAHAKLAEADQVAASRAVTASAAATAAASSPSPT